MTHKMKNTITES